MKTNDILTSLDLNKIDNSSNCTKIISGTEKVLIDACDGKEILINAKDVFLLGIDNDFKNWDLYMPGIATKETEVHVHELIQDSTLAQMFNSLEANLDKICFTQAQIINFCKKYSSWLCKKEYATFFLFKNEDQFFVAFVYVEDNDLYVDMREFKHRSIFYAENAHHLVIPKLKP